MKNNFKDAIYLSAWKNGSSETHITVAMPNSGGYQRIFFKGGRPSSYKNKETGKTVWRNYKFSIVRKTDWKAPQWFVAGQPLVIEGELNNQSYKNSNDQWQINDFVDVNEMYPFGNSGSNRHGSSAAATTAASDTNRATNSTRNEVPF